jgi:hypothetical protein
MQSTMDLSPQRITALAEELSALANSLETFSDPATIKYSKEAFVLKAKNLIAQVQDPMDAVMDHFTNVGVLKTHVTCKMLV